MTDGGKIRATHPFDIEMEKRAIAFHEKLAVLKTYNGNPPWDLLCETAAASHFLYDAKRRSPTADFWERPVSFINLVSIARENRLEGSTLEIGKGAAEEMIFRATEDPDYFEGLKTFCEYALTGEPMPNSGETTFTLHPLLFRWIGKVSSRDITKVKTRKRQVLSVEIVHEAIANTVQFLHDQGVPIFRNPETESSVNACDAVAEISGEALGRKPIKGDAVKKIYYASIWRRMES
ncbi:hypothetical protein FTO60_12505 [Octadecabacter sp. SW4]|uniref:hypothetical protein n=1 Tax=Octadecabacter sp. SW4 TaxID=2602067 RepID=UPI0011C1ECAC|nr:hypothetical protein [Octadecabacter sp. SW4]QEE36460.1 hypothetical protein FTO60_12505 [Octadecabacter sp. SW4]